MHEADYRSHVASIIDALPGVVVVIEEPSFPYGSKLMEYCSCKQIHVSETSRRIYQVVEPWKGTADDLHSLMWSQERFNPWCFLVPFIPPTPYAMAGSIASRRGGGVSVWVNASHSKIAALVEASKKAKSTGRKMPECVRFFQFIHQFHGGVGTDPEYVEYVQQHQRKALDELERAGVVEAADREAILFRAEDFIPWERAVS